MTKTIKNRFTVYSQGGLPIILSAPHGGDEKPKDISTRTDGVFEKDDFTLELAQEIEIEFYKQTGLFPYSAIATISREKIDLNREAKKAYEDFTAKEEYNYYHSTIKNARKTIKKKFGKGLFIDIHGQSHPDGFIEFGYLLDNDILKLKNKKLKKYRKQSSIKTLGRFSPKKFTKQLKGKNSLGSLMTKNGFKSIPSKQHPYAKDDNYFEGAFNTYEYGSLDGGVINGIQVEFPYKGCRDTKENRQECAKAFVSSVLKFMKVHLDINYL